MNPWQKPITLSIAWHVFIIGFLLLATLLAALSFGGYKLYQKVLATEKMQKELLEAQNADRLAKQEEAAKLILAQKEELTLTKAELEKTKTEAEKTSAQIKTLSQTVQIQSKAQKEIVISSADLASYVTGVVQVICSTPKGLTSGSGSLFSFKELKRAVLTNHHVVKDAEKCVIIMTDTANNPTGMFALKGSLYTFNESTDEAIIAIGEPLSKTSVPIENYNYSLSTLKKCPSPFPIGTPVVIIGYPAYAKRDGTVTIETIGTINSVYRTATNGIISGYDTSRAGNPDYFVSAKIDNGNSGGIALAKDATGLCTLGLPTWLTVGNYETQGLVQNITNLLPESQ